MEISTHKLYRYSDIRRLLLTDSNTICFDQDNGPMNKRNIKMHKGTDNTVYFKTFSPAGQPSNISHYTVYGRLIDANTGEQLVERMCVQGVNTGTMSLTFNEGDITDIEPGLYSLVLIGQEDFIQGVAGEVTSTPFFTDFDSNVTATVEITEQAQRTPLPSYEITSWTENRIDNGVNPGLSSMFVSAAIPSSRVSNHVNNVHTFSVETTSYYGTLAVYGTLDATPNPGLDRGWFTISVLDLDEDFIEFVNVTGNNYFTFEGNYMYLKFVYTPSVGAIQPGTVDKITIRA